MRVYVLMHPLPWEQFHMTVTDAEGNPVKVSAKSDATSAGFLPIFWNKEDAERLFPGVTIQEAEVDDNWHEAETAP